MGSVQDGEVLRAGQGPQDGWLQKARWAAGGTTKQVMWNHQELGCCTGGGGGGGPGGHGSCGTQRGQLKVHRGAQCPANSGGVMGHEFSFSH